MTFIEKSKEGGASNGQIVQRLQQLELLSQTMAKDLSEIRQLMQAQSTNEELLKLKENMQDDAEEPEQSEQPENLLIEAAPADLGTVIDKNSIRFERALPGSIETIWKYFSDPVHLSEWLAEANVQPFVGGRVDLNFGANQRVDGVARIRGLVSQFQAPASIAYSWIDTQTALQSHVSFELTEADDDTKLVLTHTGIPEDKLAEFLAVWHARLDVLIARLKNIVPPDFGATFRKLLPIYSTLALTIVVSASPASAAVSQESYHTIQTERSHLLTKYDNHWRDADELEKEIVRLKHENNSSAEQTIDHLDQKLKNEYRDLHQIELDIRELDKALL
ncbi:MAG: SRPBCC domain-containing protein [Candidatus Melainabacteria bacterium]|nr:SRPBCC domain-containing protein [Candidatus Melainabacteria bacterium]